METHLHGVLARSLPLPVIFASGLVSPGPCQLNWFAVARFRTQIATWPSASPAGTSGLASRTIGAGSVEVSIDPLTLDASGATFRVALDTHSGDLNGGYFVLAELPMRKSIGTGYSDITDIDIIAVRFPHPSVADAAAASKPLDLLLGSDPELKTFEQGVDVIIGEVKEGRAELNPALHRQETIEFALRRLGCCPPREIRDQAAAIVRTGAHEMRMGGMACRIRLVLFAGHGTDPPTDLVTVPLNRCVGFIQDRMQLAPRVMAGTQWKDATLAMFALLAKLRARGPAASESRGGPESVSQPGTLSS